jgi:hypothetical protein
MASHLEYHRFVRRFIPSSVAFLALLAAPVLASCAFAQINGAPSSVTSPGFGGRSFNGTAPSVTSVGPRGYTSGYGPGVTFTQPNRPANGGVHNRDGHDGHHHRSDYGAPYLYYYGAFPYATDDGAADYQGNDNAQDDADYQGGPTVFDRRGSGADSYVPPVTRVQRPHDENEPANDDANAEAAPEQQPQEPTVLVFKDGHQMQVSNYAIVGPTLFDLTPGHPRKIALADLDVDATQKLNDDHGVVFRLPPSA